MQITSSFDSGNIDTVACESADDIRLRIRVDNESLFFQWFHYRLTNAVGQECRMKIENAGQSAYIDGWKDYQAVASYDRQYWFRVPTEFDGDALIIEHEPEQNSVYYAYFAPYSTERHRNLIAAACQSPLVRYHNLGHSLDGQDMDLIEIGDGPLNIWTIARQHPGESMAEWWMEGFLDRLLDTDDPVARQMLAKATLHIVPNMNPDGTRRGHLRTNAAGANLNREWAKPSMESSPEVFLVRDHMHKTGVDFCLDVHGDEALPYNFIAGAESVENWSDRMQQLQDQFKKALQVASPDFQTEIGYDIDEPGSSNLKKNTDYMAQTFDCLAMTLEMPFKDTSDNPMPETGWSPVRCQLLGAACLDAMRAVVDDLR